MMGNLCKISQGLKQYIQNVGWNIPNETRNLTQKLKIFTHTLKKISIH